MDKSIPKRFDYQNENWAILAGGNIISVIDEYDVSGDYEVEEGHLYKLDSGRFAVVQESGCSCYSLADASIETFDTLKAARAAYNVLKSEHTSNA